MARYFMPKHSSLKYLPLPAMIACFLGEKDGTA